MRLFCHGLFEEATDEFLEKNCRICLYRETCYMKSVIPDIDEQTKNALHKIGERRFDCLLE